MSDTENEHPPVPESTAARHAPLPATSLPARLLNIFAIPGHVFEEVLLARSNVGNWLVPMFLCGLALAVSALIAYSQPSGRKDFSERFEKARAAQALSLAESVKAGHITQADADKAIEIIDLVARPEVVKSLAAAGGFCMGVAGVFWWAFVLWMLARSFLKSPVPYGKALEVAGLASMVGLLNTVVRLAITVKFGNIFSGSGFSLSVTGFDSPGQQMLAAAALNLVDFWFVAVLGVGLGRLAGVPWVRGILLVFACWVGADVLLQLFGLAAAA